MTTREEILEETRNLPEDSLDKVRQLLESMGRLKKVVEPKEDDPSELNALAKIRQIRISATPDFSIKAKLYGE